MSNKKDQDLHKVLLKHNLAINISKDNRDHFEKNKQKNLKKVLKKTGMHSFWSSIVISFMFFLKKFGIGFTYLQSLILLIVLINVAVVGIIIGSIVVVNSYVVLNDVPAIKENKNQFIKKVESLKESLEPKKKIPIEKIISIQPFKAINIKKSYSNKTANAILNSLSKYYGKDKVRIRKKGEKIHQAGMIVMGSIEYDKDIDEYIIDVSLVKVKNNVVISGVSESLSKLSEIDSVCEKISKKFNNSLQ